MYGYRTLSIWLSWKIMSKKLGVITLPNELTFIKDAITTLKEMSETFRKRNWEPREIGKQHFVRVTEWKCTKLPHCKTKLVCKDGKSFFRIKRWTGEEDLRAHHYPRLLWISIRGLPLHAWSRDTFIKIMQDSGQLLEVDLHSKNMMNHMVARVKVECQKRRTSRKRD